MRVFSNGDAENRHALRERHVTRNVLERVHSKVRVAANDGSFHFADEQSLSSHLGQRAICDPVAGLVEIPCAYRNASAAVNAVAAKHGLPVIEDAAQAIGARDVDGRMAGSLGTIGCFSFYPSKNLGAAGDGGMITTSDGDLAHTMAIMRNHGMEPAYHHELLGGNFRLDGIQAAVLSIKLKHLDAWADGRRRNATDYRELFADRALPTEPGLPAYLARRIERSFAAAAEAVDRIDAASLATRRKPTRRLAAEALGF